MCAFYLVCGMTYEQYWFASPYLVQTYREYFRLKQEQENQKLWLMGAYNLAALNVAIGSAMGGKGAKPKYPDKPFDIFPKTEKQMESEIKSERNKAIDNLNAWKHAMENKYGANNNKP